MKFSEKENGMIFYVKMLSGVQFGPFDISI